MNAGEAIVAGTRCEVGLGLRSAVGMAFRYVPPGEF